MSVKRRLVLVDDTPDVEAFADAHADLHRHARTEVARFNREQPPQPIPRRTYAATVPGLVAGPILGHRVIRRLE